MRWRWSWLVSVLVLGASADVRAAPQRYDGHTIVRIDAPTATIVADLQAAGAEVLDDRPGPAAVHLRLPPSAQALLAASGANSQIVVVDIQAGIDAERERLSVAGPVAHGASFFDDFRDLPAVEAHIDALALARPDIVQGVTVGNSLEGRPIRGISIRAGDPDGPSILLTGTMHAREWLGTMTVTCLADALVSEHGADPAITAALDAVGIIVVPVLNPDGYLYSWEVERYWRKNRRDGVGVDLNRNFPYQWGGEGSSGKPGDENYRGSAPASEPETTALVDFIEAQDTLVAHVDYHTFGQLLLYPWGYTGEPTEDDAEYTVLAQAQVDAMEAVYGADYLPLQGSELYPAAGVVDDWTYGELGLISFVPELRPSFEGPGDFVVDPSNIVPTCEESLAGLLVLADWAVNGIDPPDPPADTGPADTGPADAGDDDAADGPTMTTAPEPDPSASASASGPTSDGGPPSATTLPAATDDDGTGSGEDTAGAVEGRGCACGTGDSPQPLPTAMLVIGLGLLRRRR